MGLITRDCPHCHSENVAFSSFGEIANPHEDNSLTVPFYCAKCYGGIFAVIYCFTNKRPNLYKGYLDATSDFKVKTTYPVSGTKA